MSKRVKIDVYNIIQIRDKFGGYSEERELVNTIYGILMDNLLELQTEVKGTFYGVTNWVKTHRKIANPIKAVLEINGEDYKIVNIVTNRRRNYYQIEKISRGSSYAD